MPKMPFSKAELEEFLDGLSPEEKSAFWQRFNQWIYEGAQAQGALSAIGAVLGLGALYALVRLWIELGWNAWYVVYISDTNWRMVDATCGQERGKMA